jgi:ATP phosphoribosyltransferase regulatory subunit
LALASLSRIFAKYKLSLSSVALVDALLAAYGIAGEKISVFYEALKERNLSLLSTLCEGEAYSALSLLFRVENDYERALAALKSIAVTKESLAAVSSLEAVLQGLPKDAVSLDFSITSFDGYYNGVVFKGFVDGIASPVLSGGQYDKLMKKMGRKSSAIGFAVYMDTIAGYSPALAAEKDEYIHVALPKGRLGEKIYEMFEKAGYPCPEIR